MKKHSGMTLIELMIVVAILGGLFLITIGPLMGMVNGQRVKSISTQIFSTLIMARSEAVKRNTCVDVVPVDSTDWSLGWSVQVPTTAGAASCTGGGTPITLRSYDPVDPIGVTGPSVSVRFNGAGRLMALGDSSAASLCNNTCSSACTVNNAPPSFRVQWTSDTPVYRCVSVRSSGAPEVKKGS